MQHQEKIKSKTTNPLADRERSLQAAFFRKVDAKLLEDMRSRMAKDQDIERLAADTGIHDQDVLKHCSIWTLRRGTCWRCGLSL